MAPTKQKLPRTALGDPPPSFLFSVCVCVCVCIFSRHRHSPAVRFLSFTCLKSTSVKKKRMRCRGDVGHPEVGLRMSTGPHPPPAIYCPRSKVPEPSRRGGGQGNHIDRTRLHKRLVVLTSRITEETRASSPNNGGHFFCFNI